MKKIYITTLLLFAAMSPHAGAVVLWEQAPDTELTAVVDQEFPDFPDFSTYMVHDISVTGDGWLVDSVTTFFTSGSGNWPSGTDASLHIFEKTGTLPDNTTDIVPDGTVYTAMITSFGSYLELTVDSLALFLAPGDYWIGLTPILEFDPYGQEFHQATTAGLIGDPTAMRNPGDGFGFGADWATNSAFGGTGGDYALRIEGRQVPEPGMLALLLTAGLLASLSVRTFNRK